MSLTRSAIGWAGVLAAAIAVFSFACASGGDDNDATLSDDGTIPSGADTGDDDTTAGDDTAADDDTAEAVTVAIVHNNNLDAVIGYGAILDFAGLGFFGVDESDFPGADLSGADVVLVDTETNWYELDAAADLKSTGLPILGIGPGGMHLYDNYGFATGFSNTNGFTYFNHNAIVVRYAAHAVFKKPYEFVVSDGNILNLFFGGLDLYAVTIDPLPSGVVVIGSLEGDDTLSAIVIEDKKYMSWGFDAAPEDLSADGQALLVNCLVYLAGK